MITKNKPVILPLLDHGKSLDTFSTKDTYNFNLLYAIGATKKKVGS